MSDTRWPRAADPAPPQFRDAWIEAATVAFREVAGTDVVCAPADSASLPAGAPARSARIELAFPSGRGVLALSVTEAAAVALANRVLAGQDLAVDDALVGDCLGEIANVVAGQGKAIFSGTDWHYTFGTPRVASGFARPDLSDGGFDCHTFAFRSDLGPIVLEVAAMRQA